MKGSENGPCEKLNETPRRAHDVDTGSQARDRLLYE